MATGKTLRKEGNKSNLNILVEGTSNPITIDESNKERKKKSDSRLISKEMTDELKYRRKNPTTFIIDPGLHTFSDTIKRMKTRTDKSEYKTTS